MKKQFTLNAPLKFFIVITMLYVTVAVACDIVAYKMVKVGSLASPGSAIIFPLLYVFVDILTEIFGGKNARFVVWVHVLCDFMFTYIIILISHLPSPSSWHLQEAYNTVIDPMQRLYVAGLIGILVSSFVNIRFLSKWKALMKGKYFWLRSTGATIVGIMIYTLVTDLIAFSSVLDTKNLLSVTLFNLTTNSLFSIVYTGFAAFLVGYVKTKLKIDTYESVKFDPFKLSKEISG